MAARTATFGPEGLLRGSSARSRAQMKDSMCNSADSHSLRRGSASRLSCHSYSSPLLCLCHLNLGKERRSADLALRARSNSERWPLHTLPSSWAAVCKYSSSCLLVESKAHPRDAGRRRCFRLDQNRFRQSRLSLFPRVQGWGSSRRLGKFDFG